MPIKNIKKATKRIFNGLIALKGSDSSLLWISIGALILSSFPYQQALKRAPAAADLLHRSWGVEHTTIYLLWGFVIVYLFQFYSVGVLTEGAKTKERRIKLRFIIAVSLLVLSITRILTPLVPESIGEDMLLSNFFIYYLGGHISLPVTLVGAVGLANIRPLPNLRRLLPLLAILLLVSYLAITSGYYYSLDIVGALTTFPLIEELSEFLTKSKIKAKAEL